MCSEFCLKNSFNPTEIFQHHEQYKEELACQYNCLNKAHSGLGLLKDATVNHPWTLNRLAAFDVLEASLKTDKI